MNKIESRLASCPRCGLPDNGSASFAYFCTQCSWSMSEVVYKKPDGSVGVLAVGEYDSCNGRYWAGAFWVGRDDFLEMYLSLWEARVARVVYG